MLNETKNGKDIFPVVVTETDKQFSLNKPVAKQMLQIMQRNDVISPEDNKFLADHAESLQKTLVNTWIWRTSSQHESIISDHFHPTLHSKFHQAILEQKVQFTESVRLAKEFAMLQLAKEENLIKLEEVEENIESVYYVKEGDVAKLSDRERRKLRMYEIEKNRLQIALQETEYQLTEMKIAMDYRMKEVRSWENIKTVLYNKMKELGLGEEEIYNKEYGEVEGYFYLFINNLKGVEQSTDGGEVNNLIGLARWIIAKAKCMGIYELLIQRCTKEQLLTLQKYAQYLN